MATVTVMVKVPRGQYRAARVHITKPSEVTTMSVEAAKAKLEAAGIPWRLLSYYDENIGYPVVRTTRCGECGRIFKTVTTTLFEDLNSLCPPCIAAIFLMMDERMAK